MRAGTLRHRVEIQALTVTEDDIGNQIYEWQTIATVCASIEPLKGREYWAAAQIQAETTVKVTIRYLAGITPSCRVVFKDRVFDIQSIINVEERNRELVLMCREKDEEA